MIGWKRLGMRGIIFSENLFSSMYIHRYSMYTCVCTRLLWLIGFAWFLSSRIVWDISTQLYIIFGTAIIAQFTIPDSNGNIDPEAPPSNYGRRRSRAVLYQLSGHYKQDNKHKIKLNNVRLFISFGFITESYCSLAVRLKLRWVLTNEKIILKRKTKKTIIIIRKIYIAHFESSKLIIITFVLLCRSDYKMRINELFDKYVPCILAERKREDFVLFKQLVLNSSLL